MPAARKGAGRAVGGKHGRRSLRALKPTLRRTKPPLCKASKGTRWDHPGTRLCRTARGAAHHQTCCGWQRRTWRPAAWAWRARAGALPPAGPPAGRALRAAGACAWAGGQGARTPRRLALAEQRAGTQRRVRVRVHATHRRPAGACPGWPPRRRTFRPRGGPRPAGRPPSWARAPEPKREGGRRPVGSTGSLPASGCRRHTAGGVGAAAGGAGLAQAGRALAWRIFLAAGRSLASAPARLRPAACT